MNAVPSAANATETGSRRPPIAVTSRNPVGTVAFVRDGRGLAARSPIARPPSRRPGPARATRRPAPPSRARPRACGVACQSSPVFDERGDDSNRRQSPVRGGKTGAPADGKVSECRSGCSARSRSAPIRGGSPSHLARAACLAALGLAGRCGAGRAARGAGLGGGAAAHVAGRAARRRGPAPRSCRRRCDRRDGRRGLPARPERRTGPRGAAARRSDSDRAARAGSRPLAARAAPPARRPHRRPARSGHRGRVAGREHGPTWTSWACGWRSSSPRPRAARVGTPMRSPSPARRSRSTRSWSDPTGPCSGPWRRPPTAAPPSSPSTTAGPCLPTSSASTRATRPSRSTSRRWASPTGVSGRACR